MAYTPKEERLDIANLLQDFSQTLEELNTQESGLILPITDFTDKIINLGAEFQLTKAQLLFLKITYGLDLDEDDLAILQAWVALDKTTWSLKKKKPPQVVVLESGRRSGKCFHLNSISLTKDQGMIYGYEALGKAVGVSQNSPDLTKEGIRNIAIERQLEDTSIEYKQTIAIEGNNKRANTKYLYINGFSETKKVTTACGYNLEATPEHRLKVIDTEGNIVWRYFKDIKVGEYIGIHRSTNIFPDKELKVTEYIPECHCNGKEFTNFPTTLNSNWGYLLGLAVANGSWTDSKSVTMTCHLQDKETYETAFQACGIIEYRAVQTNLNSLALTVQFSRKQVRQFLVNLGWVDKSKPDTKMTPWSIRQSPKDVQASYLSGLFDGDGSVEKQGKAITFSSASKSLAQETQLLLLNFGIITTFKEKIIKGKPYYILTIRGRKSVEIFVEQISFKLERKQSLVINNLNSTVKDGGDTERIPYQKDWLIKLRDTLPINAGKQPGSRWKLNKYQREALPQLKNLRLEYNSIVGNSIKPSSTELFSYYRLPQLIEFAESYCLDGEAIAHFKYIQECNYFYDPVVSVEDSKAYCIDFTVPGVEQYVAQGMTNHNTTSASIIGAYEFYCMCMLDNPQSHYGLAQSTPIEILILATTATQAKTSIFRQVAMLLKTSPFFNKLIDRGLLFIGKEEIAYESKGLYIKSGNSKSSSQVGGTIKCMIMDEVARFADSNGVSNAMELWSNLGISCAPFKDKAKRVAISSAWEENDAIYQLYKSTENSLYSVGFKLSSWELNTNISRDNPIVAYEYDRDPNVAALEFEGIRPTIQSAYLDSAAIDRATTGESVISANPLVENNLVKLDIFYCEPRVERDTALHVDPGVKKDAYALAFAHPEFDEDNRLIVVVDGLLAWEPSYSNEVCMSDVGEKIRYINERRPLISVTADHYNSTETIQRLKQDGIPSEIVYFSNKTQFMMYSVVRSLLNEGRLILPKDSLWTPLVVRELKRVQMLKDRKIDHPPSESKDLADAVAAVAYKLNEKTGFLNNPLSNLILPKQPAIQPLPSYKETNNFRKTVLSKISSRRNWEKKGLKL